MTRFPVGNETGEVRRQQGEEWPYLGVDEGVFPNVLHRITWALIDPRARAIDHG